MQDSLQSQKVVGLQQYNQISSIAQIRHHHWCLIFIVLIHISKIFPLKEKSKNYLYVVFHSIFDSNREVCDYNRNADRKIEIIKESDFVFTKKTLRICFLLLKEIISGLILYARLYWEVNNIIAYGVSPIACKQAHGAVVLCSTIQQVYKYFLSPFKTVYKRPTMRKPL